MRKPLTNETLKELEAEPGRQLEVFDATLPAFGIRVGAKSKTFFLVYRSPDGKKRRLSLGSYPEVSLKQARAKAKAMNPSVHDPGAEREREREVKNFAGLAAAYLKARDDLRPSARREYERIVTDELVPAFGATAPSKITRFAVRTFLDEKAKTHATMSNRIRSIAHAVFEWANENEITTSNPVAGIKARKETKRDHVLKDDEVRAIWKATEKESPVQQSFVRVLFLTGLRRSEVLGAKWEDVDLEGGYWRIPAVATKSQMRLDVPLTAKLREIFEALRMFNGSRDHVFASSHVDDRDVPISGVSQLKRSIDKRSDVTGWRFHDVRRTVITRLGEMGCSDEVKRALLGHAQNGALGHYDHATLPIQKRDWLERWQSKLEQIVNAEPAEVVEMTPRKKA